MGQDRVEWGCAAKAQADQFGMYELGRIMVEWWLWYLVHVSVSHARHWWLACGQDLVRWEHGVGMSMWAKQKKREWFLVACC